MIDFGRKKKKKKKIKKKIDFLQTPGCCRNYCIFCMEIFYPKNFEDKFCPFCLKICNCHRCKLVEYINLLKKSFFEIEKKDFKNIKFVFDEIKSFLKDRRLNSQIFEFDKQDILDKKKLKKFSNNLEDFKKKRLEEKFFVKSEILENHIYILKKLKSEFLTCK